jgi:hypothetical protein
MALAIEAGLWALALIIPGLVLERQLISARFAALHDRSRMKGLYEVTLEANRGLRLQAVLDTILGAVRPTCQTTASSPRRLSWRPAAVAGRVGAAPG